jgi:hypothetical protein
MAKIGKIPRGPDSTVSGRQIPGILIPGIGQAVSVQARPAM